MADREGMLRELTVVGVLQAVDRPAQDLCLDKKTEALVKLAALVALGATAPSYLCAIECARDAGATTEEVVDTLVALSGTVGLARVVVASPQVASALGFDIDGPLEESWDA